MRALRRKVTQTLERTCTGLNSLGNHRGLVGRASLRLSGGIIAGCASDSGFYDEEDPASTLDHEWWDEGPPEGEEAAASPEEWYPNDEMVLDELEADASDEKTGARRRAAPELQRQPRFFLRDA